MKNILSVIKIGIKYLLRYKRRYYFLLAALIFSYAIISFITTTKDGMYDSVYYSAQSHYSGDIVAVAHDFVHGGFLHRMGQEEIDIILNAAKDSGINIKETVYRTFGIGTPALHHIGNSADLRYLMGVDELSDNEIVISVPVADKLKASLGDRIVLELDTRYGQKNTSTFTVTEIVSDTSIFGYYKAYIPRIALNRLLLYNDNDASQIGFYLNNVSKAEKQRLVLYNFLQSRIQTGANVHNRDEMIRERDKDWKGNVIFLYTMPVYLSDISNILNAMNLLTYLLFIMMIITISASAGVTYNLILNERAKEFGIMRVIGFYGTNMRIILWTEIVLITLVSILAGFILSCILSFLASFISFAWFPGFEIFLKDGRLLPEYSAKTIISNSFMLLFVIMLLALYYSNKIAKKRLPSLLSGESL